MSTNKILNMMQRMMVLPMHMNMKLYGLHRDQTESVYFYTFHKCASMLFARYILKNIRGLRHVDYAGQIYAGKIAAHAKLIFRARGYIYGPIRLSANPLSPVYTMLIAPMCDHEFIRDKIAIFCVRDPRDILVSSYYSAVYTHGFSLVEEMRERQELDRSRIRAQTLDEYVLESAPVQAKNFEILHALARACERSVLVKYEDMINNFEYFIARLRTYLIIDEHVVQEIYQRSRPRPQEDLSSHHRSGRVGGFRSKLTEKTILSLNRTLKDTLALFAYDV